MDQAIKLGALAASAALLQACGSGDGSAATTETPVYNGGLHRTAAQMLYLSNTYQVSDLYKETAQSVTNFDDLPYEEARYSVSSNAPVQYFLLRMLSNGRSSERPFSKEYFDHWITYQLANSFVLAVGEELSTVGSSRIQTHLSSIRSAVENESDIKAFMLKYFLSDIFWARFRSPEDNGREVLEVYLGDFRDEVVPKVATILKNYSFDESQGTLEIALNRNRVAQDIDGTSLTTPEQLYTYVVNHAQFMPHIYKHCVKALYGYEDSAVINTMQTKGLSTFRAIYLEALTHPNIAKVKRAKFPEEILLPMVKAFDADLRRDDINTLVDISSQVGAKPMYSKLERRAPDWNTLNTAVLSTIVDTRITQESAAPTNYWSYGLAQIEFKKLYDYLSNNDQLLTYLHERIWGQSAVVYPAALSALLVDSSLSNDNKLRRALKIVAMNYSFYTYPQESQA